MVHLVQFYFFVNLLCASFQTHRGTVIIEVYQTCMYGFLHEYEGSAGGRNVLSASLMGQCSKHDASSLPASKTTTGKYAKPLLTARASLAAPPPPPPDQGGLQFPACIACIRARRVFCTLCENSQIFYRSGACIVYYTLTATLSDHNPISNATPRCYRDVWNY